MPKKKSKTTAIKEYGQKIEAFLLKHKDRSYSELQIAKQVLGVKTGKFPSSQEQLIKLSHVNDALKLLLHKGKVKTVLIEDPVTKEQVMHYSIIGWYVTP